MPLLFHQLRAGEPQLHARVGVDNVIDALVIGNIAAGHAGVRSVDDGIAAERCDISLPEIEPRLHGNKIVHICNALGRGLALQVFILHAQKLRPGAARPADVHQSAQKLPLVLGVGRNIPGIAAFLQQRPQWRQWRWSMTAGTPEALMQFCGQTGTHRAQPVQRLPT